MLSMSLEDKTKWKGLKLSKERFCLGTRESFLMVKMIAQPWNRLSGKIVWPPSRCQSRRWQRSSTD